MLPAAHPNPSAQRKLSPAAHGREWRFERGLGWRLEARPSFTPADVEQIVAHEFRPHSPRGHSPKGDVVRVDGAARRWVRPLGAPDRGAVQRCVEC